MKPDVTPFETPLRQTGDTVEVLLRRIAKRLVAPGFVSGAAILAGGCSTARELDRVDGGQAPDARAQVGDGQVTIGPAPGEPLSCTPGSVRNLDWLGSPLGTPPVNVAGLELAAATPDYVQLRQVSFDFDGAVPGAQTPKAFTLFGETGERCATASDQTCSQQLAALIPGVEPAACFPHCLGYAVVTTEGDLVKQWSGLPALRELLGPVDSVDDALLLVTASGYPLTCEDPSHTTVREVDDGYEVFATRRVSDCPIELRRTRLHVSRDGEVRALESVELATDGSGACAGRKPQGLRAPTGISGPSALADFLARCAHMEDASVHAFVRMARELAAHGAPSSLIERAISAAEDEQRHARVVRRLAQARGGRVEPALVAELPVRDLEQIALENALEGCVRETYGALVGAHQASQAEDMELRAAMTGIAHDEAQHASLSHALHGWLMTMLEPAARERVCEAQRRAVAELRDACATMEPEPWHAHAGLPSRSVAQAMIEALDRELWQVAA